MQDRFVSGSGTPQCLFGSNTLPEILLCDRTGDVLVPFCCFLSGVEVAEGEAPHLCEGEGEDLRSSWDEGEVVEVGRLSRGERAGLGRPSFDSGEELEREVGGPLAPLPFGSFSESRWDEGGGMEQDLWGDVVEELRRT